MMIFIRSTDARVNVVVQDLYAKYPDVAALAAAEPEAIEAIVRNRGIRSRCGGRYTGSGIYG